MGRWRCAFCGRVFGSLKTLREHVIADHVHRGARFCCPCCGACYSTVTAVTHHARQTEGDECHAYLYAVLQSHRRKKHYATIQELQGRDFPVAEPVTEDRKRHTKRASFRRDARTISLKIDRGLLETVETVFANATRSTTIRAALCLLLALATHRVPATCRGHVLALVYDVRDEELKKRLAELARVVINAVPREEDAAFEPSAEDVEMRAYRLVTVKFDPELLARLDKYATRMGVPRSYVLRTAVEHFLRLNDAE